MEANIFAGSGSYKRASISQLCIAAKGGLVAP